MMAADNVLAPDAIELRRFLELAAELGQIHLVAIHPTRDEISGRDFGLDVDAAESWAINQNRAGRGVYWSPNRIAPGVQKKPSKADVTGARFVHVDLDPPKGETWTAEQRGAALGRLQDCQPYPSLIVDSGGGFNAYWRLEDECRDPETVESINRALGEKLGADACWNVDRILRVAGTVNWPNAKKTAAGRFPRLAEVVEEEGGEHSIEALRAAFGAASPIDAGPKPKAAEKVSRTPFTILSPDDLRPQSPEGLRRLICESDPDGRYGGDRSKQVIGCARSMIELGYTDTEILGIVLNPANAVSEHCLDHADPRRAAQRAIKAARAGAGRPNPEGVQVKLKAPSQKATSPAGANVYDWRAEMPSPVLREFVESVLASSVYPQPEITLGAGLTMFGATLGRRYRLAAGARFTYSNLYALALLPSSRGKDLPLRAPVWALEKAGQGHIIGGSKIVSDAGLLTALTSSPVLYYGIDEVSQLMHGMLDAKSASHQKAIANHLTALFSAPGEMWRGADYAAGRTEPVCNPHLCLFGVTTQSELFGEVISPGAFSRGTMARFLAFEGDYRVDPAHDLFDTPTFEVPGAVIDCIKRLRSLRDGQLADSNRIEAKFQTLHLDAAAKALATENFHRNAAAQVTLLDKGAEAASAILGRETEHALKIALISAATAAPDAREIGEEHMHWALQVARRNTETLSRLLEERTAETPFDRKVKDFEAFIRKAGQAGVTGSQITNRFDGMTPRERDEVLNTLVDAGRVLHQRKGHGEKGGRPLNLYWHTDFATE